MVIQPIDRMLVHAQILISYLIGSTYPKCVPFCVCSVRCVWCVCFASETQTDREYGPTHINFNQPVSIHLHSVSKNQCDSQTHTHVIGFGLIKMTVQRYWPWLANRPIQKWHNEMDHARIELHVMDANLFVERCRDPLILSSLTSPILGVLILLFSRIPP